LHEIIKFKGYTKAGSAAPKP